MALSPIQFAWDPSASRAPAMASTAWSGGASARSEAEQVRRAAEGVEEARAWLVKRVVGPVRAVARALLRNQADADDAAQKALLEVLVSAKTYRGDGSIEAWARRIAVRTALRHARSERRQATAAAVAHDGGDGMAARPASSAMDALPRPVIEYLGELPEPQRNALLLHHALGYTVTEIAELSEVSHETVRGRLRLGTSALRKRVRQELLLGARKGPP